MTTKNDTTTTTGAEQIRAQALQVATTLAAMEHRTTLDGERVEVSRQAFVELGREVTRLRDAVQREEAGAQGCRACSGSGWQQDEDGATSAPRVTERECRTCGSRPSARRRSSSRRRERSATLRPCCP